MVSNFLLVLHLTKMIAQRQFVSYQSFLSKATTHKKCVFFSKRGEHTRARVILMKMTKLYSPYQRTFLSTFKAPYLEKHGILLYFMDTD